MLEGASLFKIYRSIIFPLAPATLVILKSISIYNDFYAVPVYAEPRPEGGVHRDLFLHRSERAAERDLGRDSHYFHSDGRVVLVHAAVHFAGLRTERSNNEH